METPMVHWGYIGILEQNMESTIVYWGYGKENGNYSNILGFYRAGVISG